MIKYEIELPTSFGSAQLPHVSMSSATCIDRDRSTLDYEATILLACVIGRLPGIDQRIIQFIHLADDAFSCPVARAFAESCVARLGRTLLVICKADNKTSSPTPANARGLQKTLRHPAEGEPSSLEIEPEIMPDPTCAGLYFEERSYSNTGWLNGDNLAMERWINVRKNAFSMIVIDSSMTCPAISYLDVAPISHGIILSIAAGVTLLPKVQQMQRQIAMAGGVIIGSVLYHPAPKDLRRENTPYRLSPKLLRRIVPQLGKR